MKLSDPVYGSENIYDPLVLEIINTSSFQRLKGINQAGYSQPHLGVKHFSRYEHCIGVYRLLRKFQAGFDEQIAGLIHDVSHSVFSHSIDYVLASGSEKKHDYQDNIHKDFVKSSDLMPVFDHYKLNVDYLLEDKNFPMKETKLPRLCADRIDYSFKEALVYKVTSLPEIRDYLNNLVVINNKWVFTNFEYAKRYAFLFLTLSSTKWAGFQSAVMFRTTGDFLKYGLLKDYLTEKDLYTTDKEVVNKLKKHLATDPQLKGLWVRFNNKVKIINDPKNYDAIVYCKSRVVDPLCFYRNEIMNVSGIDKKWQKILKIESRPKKYFLKFMD